MSRQIFRTMAVTNIRKNHRFYIPFLLTIVLTSAMFCNMCGISRNPAFTENNSVAMVLQFGVVIIGLFGGIFVFYTNSFLMKRRKKELGLYHILGMEKRHISRVLVWETVILAATGIVGGMAAGLLLDRLMFLIILKIYHYPVSVAYQVQPYALWMTCAVFGAIFLLVLLSNIRQIKRTSAIELLKSEHNGEREPKAKRILAAAGVICLGIGYYIAITTDNISEALTMFLVAVLLVLFGTYCLFLAGSITILKLLKKNKNYYYRTNHFVAVSGMIYRMKQNAVGLANICILSTGVLLVISTTVSLYASMQDILDTRFPTEISVNYDDNRSKEENERLEELIHTISEEEGAALLNYRAYTKLEVAVSREGSEFGARDPQVVSSFQGIAALTFVTAQMYAQVTGRELALQDHEVAVYSDKGELPETFTLFGEAYKVKERLVDFPVGNTYAHFVPYWFTVVVDSEEELEHIFELQEEKYKEYASKMKFEINFDVEGGEEAAVAFYEHLRTALYDAADMRLPGIECKYLNRDDAYTTFGSMLFLGIYLGLLFLMATVLIIYYKQIMEGYEDRDRYVIMQKVGMDKQEVKRSIKSQILILFFLPLGTALVHCLAAFPLMNRILQAFNMNNMRLFAGVTAVVAAVFTMGYIFVYAITARTYYHIVS